MQGIAKVLVVGNLGRAPELRHTSSGKAVGDFSVAVNDGPKDGSVTEWIKVVVWEKTAEACHQFLDKGSPVFVEGRWQTQKWTDKEGRERKDVQVVAHKVLFLGRPDAGAPPADGPQGGGGASADDAGIPF